MYIGAGTEWALSRYPRKAILHQEVFIMVDK